MRSRLWLTAGLLFLAGVACALPNATPTANTQVLATGVAATLTSIAPAQNAPTEAPSAEAPTAVPEATATPAPTPEEPFGPSAELRVVYTDAGNVWLISGETPAVQLTSSGQAYRVLISSDGERIVYLQRPPNQSLPSDVRVVHADGTHDASLMSPEQWDSLYPLQGFDHNDVSQIAFIPGTHRLLMNTKAVANAPGLFKYNDVLELNTDTGELTTVFEPGVGGGFSISPDGSHMALVQPEAVSLAAVDGSDLHANVITYPAVTTYSEYQYYAQPIWRPDSTGFGVAIPSPDPLAARTSGTIWSVSSPDGTATQLGQIGGDFFFIQTGAAPSLSPDQEWVAFLRPGAASSSPPNLVMAHPDGSALGNYDQGQIRWEGWSPNAVRFAYGSGGPFEVYIGVPEAPRLQIGQGTDLRWLNDDQFLYLQGSTGNWQLARFEGGPVPAILASPAGDFVSYDFAGPASAP
jgi:hypothetical protein